MCGRITQSFSADQLGLNEISLIEPLDALPRYNGVPGQQHLVIREHPRTGERTLEAAIVFFGCGFLIQRNEERLQEEAERVIRGSRVRRVPH